MGMELEYEIKQKNWLGNPALRIDAGFERAGFNFRNGLSRSQYPSQRPGAHYVRTYLTADKAGWRIAVSGHVMEFGSTFYLPFIIFPGQSGRRAGEPAPWPNKRDELVRLMKAGFRSGFKDYQGD